MKFQIILIFVFLSIVLFISFAYSLSLTDFFKISGMPITAIAASGICKNNQITQNCCPDLNADGLVNIKDINIIKAAYGSVFPGSKYNYMADTDKDGRITIKDMNLVKSNYGKRVSC